jgi:hypothetical protein
LGILLLDLLWFRRPSGLHHQVQHPSRDLVFLPVREFERSELGEPAGDRRLEPSKNPTSIKGIVNHGDDIP